MYSAHEIIKKKFSKLQELIRSSQISFKKEKVANVIRNYNFLFIDDLCLDQNEKEIIDYNIKSSRVMMIHQNKIENYVFIGFDKTVIALNQSFIFFLQDLLAVNPELSIFYTSSTKKIINEQNKIKNNEIHFNSSFEEEFEAFNKGAGLQYSRKNIEEIKFFNNCIAPCIFGYLLSKSYLKTKIDRTEKFFNNQDEFSNKKIDEIDENEYVELKTLGNGSIFVVMLVYHIDKEELLAIKKPNLLDKEISKLTQREISNYSKFVHPFSLKFYGIVKTRNYIVLEFINGKTLMSIKSLDLNDEDKITIIYQLMNVISYLTVNNYVYRDLKPDNVMIDENKNVVLIDFDRLIINDPNAVDKTQYFNSSFTAPEIIKTGDYSCKSDVYSLGKMMDYIITKTNTNKSSIDLSKIQEISQQCMNEIPEDRPIIIEAMLEFYISYHTHIKINIKEKFDEMSTEYKQKYNFYFSFLPSSSKDIANVQFNIGTYYYNSKSVNANINKVIHYFKLAAEQNHPNAQLLLGFIYNKGEYVPIDIKKSLHYYSLAADQNVADAQFI